MKVHKDVGKTVSRDKYVGDILIGNGTNTENIKERTDKGYGIVNNILSILIEIPPWTIQDLSWIEFTRTMLLNAMLFNSEIWYNVK